jgi:hypothetical protein
MYTLGDCQSCPALVQNSLYVNANPNVGADNVCCGRTQQAGLGGPCLTLGYAIEITQPNADIDLTGDSMGNASALEEYPIHLRKAVHVVGSATCFRGTRGIPVFVAQDDTLLSYLYYVTIGTTCQGDPGGASDGVYVGKTAGGAAASLNLYDLVTIDKVENGIRAVGGVISGSGTISNVTNGLVLDGGSSSVNASITNASNAGILCQSTTDPITQSALSGNQTISKALNYDIFAGMGCRASSIRATLGQYSCPSPKTDRFGIYAEGDAQLTIGGAVIRCMSEDGITLRSNGNLSVNAPQVIATVSLAHNGCTGAYAEVGKLVVSNSSSVTYNHWGVVQRSSQSSTTVSDAIVSLPGASGMNTFKCNGKAEPGACCTNGNCPNGGDVWNNSGLPLDATNNYWRAAPVSQCICDTALQSCTCSGSAYGQTTPPDGIDILRSPFQGSNTGTTNVTGYAVVSDPSCPG